MTTKISEPTKVGIAIANSMMNGGNWKLPTIESKFDSQHAHLMEQTAYALDFYLGGHERRQESGLTVLTSKGYYHYVGA